MFCIITLVQLGTFYLYCAEEEEECERVRRFSEFAGVVAGECRRRRFCLMDRDAESSSPERDQLKSFKGTLLLAYQSLGIVYGDLSISPIYVYTSTFAGRLRLHEEDTEIFGILSLVFWTVTLIGLFKYIIITMGADDNGEGGTFALYSKLCGNSMIGFVNSRYGEHEKLTADELGTKTSLMIRRFLEKHQKSRIALFFIVLLGTSMMVGDGVLTPTMSVVSAVSGIRVKAPELHENYIVFLACVILVCLFTLQHHGTHLVGFLFAPVLIAWLLCLSLIGIYNIFKWNPLVVRALSPHYIYKFFMDAGQDGWSSLGGVVLCITGAEAMFADLGHFSKLSLRIAFTSLVYPSLVLAYMGEAAYLSQNKHDLHTSFYKSIPGSIFWPVFVIATLASIVGSQATISATFSIINQCRALSCFPRVKIIHTSNHVYGQIYIPEVNWLLLLLSLSLTIGFRDTSMIGNAYGLAAIIVMIVTTILMFLIITTVWKRHIFLALIFIIIFGSVESLYLSACITKISHGGWLPLALSLFMLSVMAIWHYGASRKLAYESQNKVHIDKLLSFSHGLGLTRVPGIGLIYSSTANDIPPMFAHFITNFPAFHRVIVFVCLQTVATPKVPAGKQFLVCRIGSPEYLLFRCIIRNGYKDVRIDAHEFEDQLLNNVAEFLQVGGENGAVVEGKMSSFDWHCTEKALRSPAVAAAEDRRELVAQREAGVSYMIGQTSVVAHGSSSFFKKIVINYFYEFLRRNCRHAAVALGVPQSSLIEVGMVYRV